MALSKKAREYLEVALANKSIAKEIADELDAALAFEARIAALEATAADHEDRIVALEP